MTTRELLNRRSFLSRASGAAFGASVANTLFDLRLVQNAMATVNVGDYKALVCVFLSGGNDANNMLIPFDDRYEGYKTVRGARLALAATADDAAANGAPNNYYGIPLATTHTPGAAYAVHNRMGAVQNLWNTGKLAFVGNVGVLAEPVTKDLIKAKARRLPPQLFSHNDQVTQWQTGVPDAISRTGWGGRTMDKVRLELINMGLDNGKISMAVSLAGSNTWEVGDNVSQFQVSTGGAVSFTNYSPTSTNAGLIARRTLMDKMLRDTANGGDAALQSTRTNLHLKDFQLINERAIANGAELTIALNRVATNGVDAASGTAINTAFEIGAAFPGRASFNNLSNLEQQLHTVARIISQRSYLNMKRQIFFVQIGGHDTHGDQPLAHANLLATTSAAIGRFYAATQALNVADKVTSFTGSDFGRTFKSNGLGSDHAWGSHHMVVGGAVNGGRLFGSLPVLELNGVDDFDTGSGATGRWIPKVSIDEYCATLARWFGLGQSELDAVFPNLDRFGTGNLGFMA